MFVRTQRLFLRPVFAEDWRAVHSAMRDGSIARMIARAPWPYREADAVEFCGLAAQMGPYCFAITVPTEPGAPLVGTIGLGPFDPERDGDALELGYWIAAPWRGRGIVGEAVNGVLGTAQALGVRRVVAGHFLDNPASGRVLRRAGFALTGEVRATACRGRGGEEVPARRYALDLAAWTPQGAPDTDLAA